MPVPKRKHSNSRTGMRRSHHHLEPKQYAYCPKCSAPVAHHTVCSKCGSYMGRAVVEIKDEE